MKLNPEDWSKEVPPFKVEKDITHSLYILKCKTENHFYVGITTYPYVRILQHMSGKGCRFTKKHGFESYKILKSDIQSEPEARKIETKLTVVLNKSGYITAGAQYLDPTYFTPANYKYMVEKMSYPFKPLKNGPPTTWQRSIEEWNKIKQEAIEKFRQTHTNRI